MKMVHGSKLVKLTLLEVREYLRTVETDIHYLPTVMCHFFLSCVLRFALLDFHANSPTGVFFAAH